jgi:glycosyltransferase involved in cell wall biosynthesis
MDSKVSIVIVARNEEAKIAACIRAAHEAAAEIGGAEIIVADSASTDQTVAIALQLGATVARLKPEWELSASAGRHVGTHYAAGEFVLFVDADTLVYTGFLSEAINELESDPRIAGVCGYLDDANDGRDEWFVVEDRPTIGSDIQWMRGGCCLYRGSAVVEVGSFNPYLVTEEEAEIGIRLTRAGWRLRMIPVQMAVHTRCTADLNAASIFTHLRQVASSGRMGGITRTLGYAIKNGYGLQFCRLRMMTVIAFGIWLMSLIFLAVFPSNAFHIAGIVAALFGFVTIWLKKGSLERTVLFLVVKVVYLINLTIGLAKVRFTPTGDYPLDCEVLKGDAPTTEISTESAPATRPNSETPGIEFSFE